MTWWLILSGGICLGLGLICAWVAVRVDAKVMGEARLGVAPLGPDEGSREWAQRQRQRRWADRLFYGGLLLKHGHNRLCWVSRDGQSPTPWDRVSAEECTRSFWPSNVLCKTAF
jgi:hypothetical protein